MTTSHLLTPLISIQVTSGRFCHVLSTKDNRFAESTIFSGSVLNCEPICLIALYQPLDNKASESSAVGKLGAEAMELWFPPLTLLGSTSTSFLWGGWKSVPFLRQGCQPPGSRLGMSRKYIWSTEIICPGEKGSFRVGLKGITSLRSSPSSQTLPPADSTFKTSRNLPANIWWPYASRLFGSLPPPPQSTNRILEYKNVDMKKTVNIWICILVPSTWHDPVFDWINAEHCIQFPHIMCVWL